MNVPRAALLGVPIAMGLGILAAGVGFVVTVQMTNGQALGPRVRTTLSANCDAGPVLVARLNDYGLSPVLDGTVLTFSLPGLPDDRSHMPAALAAPGQIVVNGTVEVPLNAGVQISLQGMAVTLLTLKGAPSAPATVTLDGVPLEITGQTGNELQVAAWASSSSDALRLATDRSVALRYPLPCPLTLSPLEDA